MKTDDPLTTFRWEVPLPDDATARRAHARATSGRRRVPRRRLVVAVAVVVAAGVAGGLYASLGGAGSDVNPQRQEVVRRAVAQVRQAFGDRRIVKATLDGSLLTVDVKEDEPNDSVLGPFEGRILTHVADQELRAAGYAGIESSSVGREGPNALSPLRSVAQLPSDACDIPAGTHLDNVTAASGRMIPLLGGFCVIRLTTSDPKSFDFSGTLNQLFSAVPATKAGSHTGRGVAFEVYDEAGVPVVMLAWDPGTNEGGAEYVRPGSSGLPAP